MNSLKALLILTIISGFQISISQNKNGSDPNYYGDTTNYAKMRDSLINAYRKEYNEHNRESKNYSEQNNQKGLGSGFFGLNLDVIFGVGFTKTGFDITNDTAGLSNSESKKGPVIGVNINFNLMGLSLGTGFSYSSKGFTSGSNSYSANYFNIPLLFAFNFNVSKVEVDLAAGPYVGILISQDKNQYYTLKNIDIGLTGSVQGSYFFNRFIGALLGVKYEHGGLNNLLESNGAGTYASSVKSRNWFIYSGIKFIL